MRNIPVRRAMTTDPLVLPRTLTVAEAIARLQQAHQWVVLVVDEADALTGLLTIQEIDEAVLEERREETLAALITAPPETIFADEPLDEAIRRLGVHDQPMLPVVARGNIRHPLGLVGRDEIFQAYSVARLAEPA